MRRFEYDKCYNKNWVLVQNNPNTFLANPRFDYCLLNHTFMLRKTILTVNAMEVHSQLTNTSDYFLTYDNFINEECLDDGCEVEDEDVAMATYVLELVLMPVFGAVGVLGNILSIIVLCKSVDKEATFHHVDMLFSHDSDLTSRNVGPSIRS